MVDDRRQAKFDLVGEMHKLHVSCRCALPDNLAENIDVVVEGTLHNKDILGQKVITRCASKYKQKDRSIASNISPDASPNLH